MCYGKDFVGRAAIAKMLKDEAIAVKAIFEPETAARELDKAAVQQPLPRAGFMMPGM